MQHPKIGYFSNFSFFAIFTMNTIAWLFRLFNVRIHSTSKISTDEKIAVCKTRENTSHSAMLNIAKLVQSPE